MTENTSAEELEAATPEERRNKSARRQKDRRAGDRYEVKVRAYSGDAFVFREFENGDEAFIVKSGVVRVFKSFSEEGYEPREVELGVVEEGAMFGEMALIDSEPRMASARVIGGGAELYVISRQHFENKLAGVNPFISKLLRILAENTRATAEKAK